jgi:hypothetical protein
MKMTQEERDGHRKLMMESKVHGGFVGGVISHDEVLALLDDADRCAELEKHLQTWIDAMERDEPGTLRCGRTMVAMFKDFRDGTGAKQYGELLKKKDSP